MECERDILSNQTRSSEESKRKSIIELEICFWRAAITFEHSSSAQVDLCYIADGLVNACIWGKSFSGKLSERVINFETSRFVLLSKVRENFEYLY